MTYEEFQILKHLRQGLQAYKAVGAEIQLDADEVKALLLAIDNAIDEYCEEMI